QLRRDRFGDHRATFGMGQRQQFFPAGRERAGRVHQTERKRNACDGGCAVNHYPVLLIHRAILIVSPRRAVLPSSSARDPAATFSSAEKDTQRFLARASAKKRFLAARVVSGSVS